MSEDRLDRLERRVDYLETSDRDHKLQIAVILEKLTTISKDMHQVSSNTTWLIRLIIGTLLIAFIGFALGGGLILPGVSQ